MHLRAKHGQPRREARHNSLKVECKETAAHLVECPSLRELRKKHGLETLKDGERFFSAQLASFLKELFKLESPSAPTSDEPELRPARAVKRHRSPTELKTTYSPSAAAKRIGVCTARGMRSVSAKPTRHSRQSASMFCLAKRGWDLGFVQRPMPACRDRGAPSSPAERRPIAIVLKEQWRMAEPYFHPPDSV
ncbi:hypothetical protein TRVL_08763 [Trypanosoma vivax]|nr:hypothetical protein TRVL_08763 [Trypanosoma vivax]